MNTSAATKRCLIGKHVPSSFRRWHGIASHGGHRPLLSSASPQGMPDPHGIVAAAQERKSATDRRPSRIGIRSASGPSAGETAPTDSSPSPVETSWAKHEWAWRNGWTVNYAVQGEGPPLVLVHGFGASLGQFRKNIPVLAEAGYRVYAVDLLGFGGSSKPSDVEFNMKIWCDQLVDFVTEVVQKDPEAEERGLVFIGNSIGSLASLMANVVLPDEAVRGSVLLNCAAGMNNKAVLGDWRVTLALPIFYLIDLILKSPLGRNLFDSVRQKETLRGALEAIYDRDESVDDELVDMFYTPSCDEGASDVFISVYTGKDCGPTPLEVTPSVQGPILVLWGDADTLTPRDGPVGTYFEALALTRPDTVFTPLPRCGHCLHDDRPDAVHAELLPWLKALAN